MVTGKPSTPHAAPTGRSPSGERFPLTLLSGGFGYLGLMYVVVPRLGIAAQASGILPSWGLACSAAISVNRRKAYSLILAVLSLLLSMSGFI